MKFWRAFPEHSYFRRREGLRKDTQELPNLRAVFKVAYEPSLKAWNAHESLAETWAQILIDVPLRLNVTKLFGCPQDDIMSICSKFGYDMSGLLRNSLTSCLAALLSSLIGCEMVLAWVLEWSLVMICQRAAEKLSYFLCGKFGYDMFKSCRGMGLIPVWRLCRQVRLAVTAKLFWIRKIYSVTLVKHGL